MAASDEPAENGERPDEIAPEVERVREERLARVPPRRAIGDKRAGDIDRQHERDRRKHPPGRLDLPLERPAEPRQSERRDDEADEREHGRLREGREVLGLPVTVLVSGIGRPPGDADREEGEQRGDEIGPGVERLGDEPQAAAREPDSELQREQHDRRADRDERGSALWSHGGRLDALGLRGCRGGLARARSTRRGP